MTDGRTDGRTDGHGVIAIALLVTPVELITKKQKKQLIFVWSLAYMYNMSDLSGLTRNMKVPAETHKPSTTTRC